MHALWEPVRSQRALEAIERWTAPWKAQFEWKCCKRLPRETRGWWMCPLPMQTMHDPVEPCYLWLTQRPLLEARKASCSYGMTYCFFIRPSGVYHLRTTEAPDVCFRDDVFMQVSLERPSADDHVFYVFDYMSHRERHDHADLHDRLCQLHQWYMQFRVPGCRFIVADYFPLYRPRAPEVFSTAVLVDTNCTPHRRYSMVLSAREQHAAAAAPPPLPATDAA
jgi:hypothetical protein